MIKDDIVYVCEGVFNSDGVGQSFVVAAAQDLFVLAAAIKASVLEINDKKDGLGNHKLTQYKIGYDYLKITCWRNGIAQNIAKFYAIEDYDRCIAKYPFSTEEYEFKITAEAIQDRLSTAGAML